ncbi:MAG: lysylphosphatidylglycerol synthase transmembrane domain-containing protein [Candidatus Bathyarchaeia archaeon]
MGSAKPKVTWKTFLLPALGMAAFFIYLYLFNVDIPTIISKIQRVDLPLYFLAAAFLVLDTFFFALSWRFLLTFLSVKLSLIRSLLYVWYSAFIDIIIPAESISGEISRVYLVTREENGAGGKVVASLVVQRLMGMGINIASLVVGASILIIQLKVSGILLNLIVLLTAIITIFLALLILLCIKEKWTLKVIEAVIKLAELLSRGRWKLTKIRGDIIKAAEIFHDSIKEFGNAPKILFMSLFFDFLSWLFNMGISYLVLLSMNFPAHWSLIVVTSSIMSAVKAIPFGVPFEAGVPEITMSTLLIMLGVSPDISATATILVRILTVWLRFFMGFASQQWLEMKAISE